MIKWTCVFLLATALACIGERSDEAAEGPPVRLAENFMSLSTQEIVRGELNSGGYKWEVVEDSPLPEGDPRPPFSIVKWRVHGFAMKGSSGEMELEFFNDRLTSVRYTPSEFSPFLQILLKDIEVDTVENSELYLDGKLRIYASDSEMKSGSIVWEDIRLVEEYNAWLRRYS